MLFATPTNVSHSNDNRHSELLFIHGLKKRIHKSLDDYKLLVCFQLFVISFPLSTMSSLEQTFFFMKSELSSGRIFHA